MIGQPDFIYFECKECGFSSVQSSRFVGTDACPLCDSDNHYVQMSPRVCRDTDRAEGFDARKAAEATNANS